MCNYSDIQKRYRNKDIILYGASSQGRLILEKFKNLEIMPIYFCDNNPDKYGKELDGINIISIEELEKIYYEKGDKLLIVITSMYSEVIMSMLAIRKIQCEIQLYSYVEMLINSNINTKNINNIRKLKDIHNGKRCFIIGNGPSLRYEDLESLKDEYTFASNRIFISFDKTTWRPTYYGCVDSLVLKNIGNGLKDISCIKMFTTLEMQDKIQLESRKGLFLNFKYFQDFDNTPMFSKDISKVIFEGYTVTYFLIQIAVYMGFKDIYLLGVDHSYSKNGVSENDYFDKRYMKNVIEVNQPRYDISTIAYEKARQYCDKNGINIYNATRGGMLEAFERVDFDSIKK